MANYHVSKHPEGGWQYKREGVSKAAGIVNTQYEAEILAKISAAKSGGGEVRIHGRDGKIRDSDTIQPAKDPFPPKDWIH
jgi:hypothetical protein